MMKQVDTAIEYAVEVPGRGYTGWMLNTVSDEPDSCTPVFDDAIQLLRNGRAMFVRMGCPEIAETLRIVARTVTVTRSDWAPSTQEVNA